MSVTKSRGAGSAIWRRLERAAATRGVATGTSPTPAIQTTAQRKPSSRLPWLLLDALGLLLWTYIPIKLFVADIDRFVLSTLAPGLAPLLDYRVIFYLCLLAVVALFLRRWWFYILYVVLFPLVVTFWKVPRFFIRHRSWPMVLGTLQMVSALFSDIRYNLITKSLAVVAALIILGTDVPWLVVPSAVYLAGLMIWSFGRRLRRLFGAPSFVEMQRRTIRRLMASEAFDRLLEPGVDLPADIEGYNPEQANQVEVKIAMGIGLNKILLLWAHQLDHYRRRFAPSLVFTLFTYVWIFFASLAVLTLLNLALLRVDPSQFSIDSPRPFVAVLVYTLSTFTLGMAGGIQPQGELALGLQFAGGVVGFLVLATLIASLVLTFVRERDDSATQELIQELRDEAQQHEERFRAIYDVGIEEAWQRLQQMQAAAASLVAFVVRAIPSEPPSKT